MEVKNVVDIIDIESDMSIEDMEEDSIDIEEAVDGAIEVIVAIVTVDMSMFIVVGGDERNDMKRGKRRGREDDKDDLMSLVMRLSPLSVPWDVGTD